MGKLERRDEDGELDTLIRDEEKLRQFKEVATEILKIRNTYLRSLVGEDPSPRGWDGQRQDGLGPPDG